MSMYHVILEFARRHPRRVERIKAALALIGHESCLSPIQGIALAAVADHYRADVILDLGTGTGNSAAVFSIARPDSPIHTFDLVDRWTATARKMLLPHAIGANVRSVLGDLTDVDFSPLVGAGGNVVLFWDAHGFDVADHVLSHVMPLIADRRHVVLCHDMSHVRCMTDLDYGNRPFWRGLQGAEKTAYAVLGWTVTVVDQVIPIMDFCARNEMEFRSFDTDVHLDAEPADVAELAKALGMQRLDPLHMGYFTMNETRHRRFPAPSS